MSRIVHVVGTGTIGMPLIGLFNRFKREWDIDEVTFHKNTPLESDAQQIHQLIKEGARLATDWDKFNGFKFLGLTPYTDRVSAIERAQVVIDCTPVGNENKSKYYQGYYSSKLFVAQGNAKGFGTPYAYGINESALKKDQSYVQVVSCNTHNIAVLLDLFNGFKILDSHFVCIRRSNDISQDSDMTPSVHVDKYKNEWGTHHGQDVRDLYSTFTIPPPVYCSSCKINTQFMHTIQFVIKFEDVHRSNLDTISKIMTTRIWNNSRIAETVKSSANQVFSFGREFGHYGRILNQTVINTPSLHLREIADHEYEWTGFCFTPQDANSLLSSAALALWYLNNKDWALVERSMEVVKPFMFNRI